MMSTEVVKNTQNASCPRPEHPQPQFERANWRNLNGEWQFEMDFGVSGRDRKLYEAEALKNTIIVPFCPESSLSGVGYKDFMNCVWYRREVELPEAWVKGVKEENGAVRLHFGAVDYKSYIYVNGQLAKEHVGGYSSFDVDIERYIGADGKVVITVCAEDDNRHMNQPRGKQSEKFYSWGCDYTRTTGIWQTVWMEYLPAARIESIQVYPDIENGSVRISAILTGSGELRVEASYEGRKMGEAVGKSNGGQKDVILELAEKHLWEPGAGRLYDLKLTYGADTVSSYFGLRSVRLDGMKFLINGVSVFQRLVLDQGFYPDGVYTAPSEEALIRDIQISMDAGFNGARLHEKAFEPRFLYHCDRMGYLVWGEHANWGLKLWDHEGLAIFLPEWIELVKRDFNHPAIIGWCPFNETWDALGKRQYDVILKTVYQTTKALDPTRPCIDTSGNYHVVTDIFDLHDYDQNPENFRARYDRFVTEGVLEDRLSSRQTYRGEASFISEYGGIKWDIDGGIESWGYGNAPKTEEEFLERYRGLTWALLENEKFFGFCYTQLYDVEQEKNGLYTFSRVPKFDMRILKEINSKQAAIERK